MTSLAILLIHFDVVQNSGLVRIWNTQGNLGPAFFVPNGSVTAYWNMDGEVHNALQQVQEGHLELISLELEVGELYHINRSRRRGVTSRATEFKISLMVIDTNNRWRTLQRN